LPPFSTTTAPMSVPWRASQPPIAAIAKGPAMAGIAQHSAHNTGIAYRKFPAAYPRSGRSRGACLLSSRMTLLTPGRVPIEGIP
jgi:hypothetical protein